MGILAKDDSAFFDLVEQAVEKKDAIAAKKIQVALQAFFTEPIRKIEDNKKKIQAISVSSDFPQMLGESHVAIIGKDSFDLGYEEAFQNVPPTKGKNFWSVVAGTNSLTFQKVAEGGQIQAAGKTGSKVYFFVDKYGGALGNTWEAREFREIFTMIQEAEIFRNKHYSMKSNVFYALLEAAAGTNAATAYDVTADGQLRRDIATINTAIYTLTYRLRDKGYGDMANAPIIIYANRILEPRFSAALKAATNSQANNEGRAVEITSRPIKMVYTYNTAIQSNRPIAVLPGRTVTKMDYMMPTTFKAEIDPLTLNELTAVWSCYGGGIGDSEQAQHFIMS
jgi:hypothetical protein